MKKKVVFVMDVRGYMDGRKIEKIKEEMKKIMDEINDGE